MWELLPEYPALPPSSPSLPLQGPRAATGQAASCCLSVSFVEEYCAWPPAPAPSPQDPFRRSSSQPLSYLEAEDPRVVLLEALVQGDDSSQDFFIQGEGGNGCQQPAVTCEHGVRSSHQRGRSAGRTLNLLFPTSGT